MLKADLGRTARSDPHAPQRATRPPQMGPYRADVQPGLRVSAMRHRDLGPEQEKEQGWSIIKRLGTHVVKIFSVRLLVSKSTLFHLLLRGVAACTCNLNLKTALADPNCLMWSDVLLSTRETLRPVRPGLVMRERDQSFSQSSPWPRLRPVAKGLQYRKLACGTQRCSAQAEPSNRFPSRGFHLNVKRAESIHLHLLHRDRVIAGARGAGVVGDQPPASVNDPLDAPCRIQPILRTDLYTQNAGLHNRGWRLVTSGGWRGAPRARQQAPIHGPPLTHTYTTPTHGREAIPL
ncbi:unnamed protein product [Spodoptera exigua]|nr:unnamed protein product [Spodoptera exigua]